MRDFVFVLAVGGVYVVAGWLWRRYQMYRLKALYKQGSEAMSAGNAATAATAFRKCARMWPSWPPFHEALGAALSLAGNKDEAEHELKLASDLEPKRAGAHLNLCYFYAFTVTDRGRDALAEFDRVRELDTELAKKALTEGPLGKKLAEIAHVCGMPTPTV